MNTRRYGLPPVDETWVYYRVGNHVFRVDHETREVLEDVTYKTNPAFF